MNDPQALAAKFQRAETELNGFSLDGLPIGICASYFFDRTFYGDLDHSWKFQFGKLLQTLGKCFLKRRYLVDFKAKVYYLKTGQDRHYCTMEQAVRSAATPEDKILVVGPMGKSDLYTGGTFFHAGPISLLRIHTYLKKNEGKFRTILEPLELTKTQQQSFQLHLRNQLLKAVSAKRFLEKQSKLMLLGADYDRGVNACCWFAAAQGLNIESFTLQHGVINPPVGFSPVHADEIWVWGGMAKKQLLKAGVPEQKIRLTGTPIVETLELRSDLKVAVRTTLGLNDGRTFVLALSRPEIEDDRMQVQLFQDIQKEFGMPNDNFVIKVHPSYPHADYGWIHREFNFTVLPIDLPYADFMNLVDILLAHNSGIAAEVLHYGKKVGIFDVLDHIPGNGRELNTWLNIPLLKTAVDFKKLEDCSNIGTAIFQQTGSAASAEIAHCIRQKILIQNQP